MQNAESIQSTCQLSKISIKVAMIQSKIYLKQFTDLVLADVERLHDGLQVLWNWDKIQNGSIPLNASVLNIFL